MKQPREEAQKTGIPPFFHYWFEICVKGCPGDARRMPLDTVHTLEGGPPGRGWPAFSDQKNTI